LTGRRGRRCKHAVAQFVEALRYLPEDRGFDYRCCFWIFFIEILLPPILWPWFDSISDTNKYQEYFLEDKVGRCVRLTTLPLSCADCLEILGPHSPGKLWVCSGLYMERFYTFLPIQCSETSAFNT
jgi:hypothetical protein